MFSLSRNASTSISIDIVDEELPKVEIEAPELVNPRKLLRIKAEVCSGAPTNMVWRSVESKGKTYTFRSSQFYFLFLHCGGPQQVSEVTITGSVIY